MLRRILTPPVICALIIISPQRLFAQLSTTDSNYLSSSLEEAILTFQSSLKENSHLFNGWQNTNYEQLSLNHPYFMQDSMQLGNVLYDGTLYKNIPLLYDESNDNLLTLSYFSATPYPPGYAVQKKQRMDLVKEKISRFTIAGHQFIRLDSSAPNMREGFYESAYKGNSTMYIKRSKKYIEEAKQKDVEIRYEIFDEYYIFCENRFYHIKSKKLLVNAFPGKEAQVKSFLNSLPIKFRKNKEKVIFETVKYYDQLMAAGSK
ncbi:MAG: hypothetical protein JSS70_12740 [Bacteroidetes bacterium]|nr:hypothetical protein [Bacteroidota bacterium]